MPLGAPAFSILIRVRDFQYSLRNILRFLEVFPMRNFRACSEWLRCSAS